MIGYQDKINQILKGAETIKNMDNDIDLVKNLSNQPKAGYDEIIKRIIGLGENSEDINDDDEFDEDEEDFK